jgi:hypothetical protein
MPWGRYLHQARIIGENIGVRTLGLNYWEEVARSHPVEEDDFSGGRKRNEVQYWREQVRDESMATDFE